MSDRIVGWVLAGSVLAQGGLLVMMGRLELRAAVQLMVAAAALALLVGQAWKFRMRMNHRVDMLLVMAAVGGLGMLIGWAVDGLVGTAMGGMLRPHGMEMACCAHAGAAAGGGGGGSSFWKMVFSFMTGGMLLAAIPASVAWTRCARLARLGWRRWVSTHLVGNAAMVLVMIWLGHALGPGLARLTGSQVVGMHVGMVLGMLVGMEGGMFLSEALLGLKPWRELSLGPVPGLEDRED